MTGFERDFSNRATTWRYLDHVHLLAQTISGAVPADAAGEVAAAAVVYGF
jgi:hypothetical protein